MYTRILIPLDGSQLAEQALPYARYLAKALALPVTLVEVIDLESLNIAVDPERSRYLDTILDERAEAEKLYLEAIAPSFDGGSVTCMVEKGNANQVLMERAAADKDSLIVMATHGRSGIQRWLLGSTADKIVHGTTNHVLLVRASEQGKTGASSALKKVIVPLDGSALAEQVLPHVLDLGRKMKLEVVLMRAYALPPTLSSEDYGAYVGELLNQIETQARDYLAEKVLELQNQGVEKVSSVVDIGYGAEEIIKLARETPDNFIAMCTHGRSGLKRWMLGSVTERVMRHSGDPVLIIRAE
jgi:nucleotide-binding universal stress UspA family protein